MVNINILNTIIKGIADQIPLVNSFYTKSPYESWNVKEVKYGSISFVITKTTTHEQTTTYNAILYYADRLTKNNSNIDSVHSDAATVIQTIVGALNTNDDEYIMVDYPVGITLFEQSFFDNLAGGYAEMVINVRGMSECFMDEYDIPEIIGISSYYTKDEIHQYFVTKAYLKEQYDELVEGVSQGFEVISNELTHRVTGSQFDEYVDGVAQGLEVISNELTHRVTSSQFDEYVDATIEGIGALSKEIKERVTMSKFDELNDGVNTGMNMLAKEIKYRVTGEKFDELNDGVNDGMNMLAKEIKERATKAQLDELADNVYTKKEIDEIINNIMNMLNK
jgi:hypothetical protein